MSLTLGSLLEDLEKQAGIIKQASDESNEKKDEKDEKKDPEKQEKKEEDKTEKDVKEAGKAVCKAEEDIQKAKEKNGEEQTKEAQAKGADLAREVMQKVASLKLNNIKSEDNMNKQASDAGKALADALLEKLAGIGDNNTVDGIGGAVPNKTQVDLAAQVAEQAAQVKVQPGLDDHGNGGTINQIFDSIVADAMAQGAAPQEQFPAQGVAKNEGQQNQVQAPNQTGTTSYDPFGGEAQEKAAAVSALVGQGFDFDHAVDMVKAAAEEIEREEEAQVKQAALERFMANGFGFEQAVELVKVAGIGARVAKGVEAAKGAAGRYANEVASDAKKVVGTAKNVVNQPDNRATWMKTLAKNKAVHLGAGAAVGAGAAAAALGREKKAAVDMLIANGVDFDSAVAAVNAKSHELFGA